jgi:holo-[acyl-carrier protein] synthase
MIVGIGTDIVRIERIRKLRPAAVARLLTPAEREYCLRHADPAERIGGRFAAKEAALKALGTGLAHGISWHEIEVLPDAEGAPKIFLTGKAAERQQIAGATHCHVSISHDAGHAIAFVLLEYREKDS